MKKLSIITISAVFLYSISYILNPAFALAADVRVYFAAPVAVRVGDEFDAQVLVDSDAPLNAYAAAFLVPTSTLKVVSFDDSRSLINVWQTRPTLYDNGLVVFVGGGTPAWSGSGGELLTLRLQALKEGAAAIFWQGASAFLANGQGTPVAAATGGASLEVVSSGAPLPPGAATSIGNLAATDTSPPRIKSLAVVVNPFGSGQKLLSFQTIDGGSGLAGNFVRVKRWFFWSDWQNINNPYPLPPGVWAVNFKATDLAGNATEETIYVWNELWRKAAILAAGAVAVIVLGLLIKIALRRRVKVI